MMFSFFKCKVPLKSYLNASDFHTHLLPGVDDGFSNIEKSLLALDKLEKIGVSKVWFTPHIMEVYPENNREKIQKEFEKFKLEYKGNIEIYLGAEYMLDSSFRKHLKEGLLVLHHNEVLVETSWIAPPFDLEELLYEITLEGYIPVVAHPERYLYMQMEKYEELQGIGCKFQLNIPSLAGKYGKFVKARAFNLLEKGKYSYVGSDLHRGTYPELKMTLRRRKLFLDLLAKSNLNF